MVLWQTDDSQVLRQGDARLAKSGLPVRSHLSPAERRERGRIAEYLHDDVCQFLSLAQVKLSISRQSDDAEERLRLAASAEELVKRANRSVRAMMLQMVQQQGDTELTGGFSFVVQDIEQLYDLKVRFVEDGSEIEPKVAQILAQCLRELLVNVVKHASVAEATVSIGQSDETIELVVSDEGRGFALDTADGVREGFGMTSVRQRTRTLGGQMQVQSQPGKGTTVTIQVPRRHR